MPLSYEKKVRQDSHPRLPLDPDAVQPGVYKWPPHLTLSLQLIVFVGGCLGTLARYGVIMVFPNPTDGWPVATFVVNLVGAFVLGLLLQSLFRQDSDQEKYQLLRLGVGTGFIGAFTTYGSFAVETDLLVTNQHIAMSVTYAVATVILGLLLSALGIYIATRRRGALEGK